MVLVEDDIGILRIELLVPIVQLITKQLFKEELNFVLQNKKLIILFRITNRFEQDLPQMIEH